VAQHRFSTAVLLAFLLIPLGPLHAAEPSGGAAAPPASADVDQLKNEALLLRAKIDDINSRLADLETAKTQQDKALAKAVGTGDFPGSSKLPGTSTSVAIHGFLSLQSMYDVNQNVGDKFGPGNILPSGNERNQTAHTWHMHDRLSRLSVETRTPTSAGALRTFFATDLYGFINGGSGGQQAIQNNSYSLRVHQAYGQLGRFLAGMTWSNFVDDPDNEETLDNAGPAGVLSERVPQIRYTMPLGKANLSFSAENPATDYASSAKPGLNELVSRYNPRPDFAVKYEIEQKWGRAQLSAVTRRLGYDDGAGHRSSADGGGITLGGTLNLPRHDTIGFNTWTGDGIMRYSPDEFGPVSSAQIANIGTAAQRLVPSNQHGAVVFGGHHWSNYFRSNLGFGFNSQTWQSFIPADASEPIRTRTIHANLLYSPLRQTDFGVEYMHGVKTFRQELKLPDTPATRYEFAAKYRF